MYLSEYASPRARRLLKPVIETLAGIPSVVLGYFALTVIHPDLVRSCSGRRCVHAPGGRDRGRDPHARRSWRRWPRTRCTRCPARSARRPTGSAPARSVVTRVVVPAAISGIVAALDPRVSRARRRDDGGGDRRRRDRESAPHAGPVRGGQTMTGAISSLAIGSDQVQGRLWRSPPCTSSACCCS